MRARLCTRGGLYSEGDSRCRPLPRLFLLRDSQSNPKAFVLTLCHHQKIKNFQILPVSTSAAALTPVSLPGLPGFALSVGVPAASVLS